MKKLFTTILGVFIGTGLMFAQSNRSAHAPKNSNRSFVKAEAPINYTGFEKLDIQTSVPTAENAMVDYTIGNTYYDLQTNSSMPSRLVQHPDGRLSGVWTQSQQTTGYSDRGSGYNTSDASHLFPMNSNLPVENIRTGFTSICVTDNGTEHVFTHSGAGIIQHTEKAAGATAWTQTAIPHQASPGGLWARSAASGNTLHVIYLTIPTGNSGAIYNGMDGTVLYCRSTDGGATWDKVDIALPGVDSTRYAGISAEDYAIEANGDNVSIGIFTQLGDDLLISSNDNGDSWNMTMVYDFPFDNFVWGDSFDIEQIGMAFDSTFHPDSTALFTTPGHGALLIDDNGVTHWWMASMFLSDDNFADDQMSIFNGWDIGIVYWNSTMDGKDYTNANTFIVAGYSPDLDGDGALGHPDQTEFYTEYRYDAVSVQPSAGMDANGQLYVTFDGPNELHLNENNTTLFRKAFIAASAGTDYTTWQDPIEVANDNNSDAGLTPFQEHTYPAMARNVMDSICVITQVDYTQGTNLNQGNSDFCQINYYGLPVELFVSAQEVRNDISINMYPNPAAYSTLVNFELEAGVQGNIVIMDMSGRLVQRTTMRNFNAGDNNVTLDISSLSTGIYMVQLNTENFISTQKLVVAK